MSKPARFKASLGNASIGLESCSIGFTAKRDDLNVGRADQLLTHARVEVTLQKLDSEEQSGAAMFGPTGLVLESVADCKRLSIGQSDVKGRFVFPSSDAAQLADFVSCDVEVRVKRVGAAGEDKSKEAA